MSVYQCSECELHFCVDCSGGQDQCQVCHLGPLCNECTVNHDLDHKEEVDTNCET